MLEEANASGHAEERGAHDASRRKAADFQRVFTDTPTSRHCTSVQESVLVDIGAREPLQDWSTIDWRLVTKRVKNLRQRISRATQHGQWNQVRSLMKLMLRSDSTLLMSVRRVTQEHHGQQTAGVDGQRALSPQDRVTLVKQMQG